MELIKNIKDIYDYRTGQVNIEKDMIKKAIDASYNMLPLNSFIRVTGFHVPDIMDLNCIMQLKLKIPVLITEQLIRSFGYSGELRKQKECLLKLIKAHNLPFIQMSNTEYKKFTCPPEGTRNNDEKEEPDALSDLYPPLVNPNGKAVHIFMMSRDLNKLMMVVNTPKGDIMREFCQTLTELFDLYVSYQFQYQSQQVTIKDKRIDELMCEMKNQTNMIENQTRKIDDLHDLNEEMHGNLEVSSDQVKKIAAKLDVATDERAPKTKSIIKHGKFMLLRLNDPESDWSYYAIRAQPAAAKVRLETVQGNFPDLTIDIQIEYQPNAINLFNLIKEKIAVRDGKIEYKGNYISLLGAYTHEQFLADIYAMDEAEKSVVVKKA
jgi:hypothetical protein